MQEHSGARYSAIRELKAGQESKAKAVVDRLLEGKGVDHDFHEHENANRKAFEEFNKK